MGTEKTDVVIVVKKELILCILGLSLLMGVGCSSPSSFSDRDEKEAGTSRDCSGLAPENPYSAGSGHYAGFEWAEQNNPGFCSGNSTSFIEGCDDYQEQLAAYEACLNKR